MLSEVENRQGKGTTWKKLQEIKCNRADSVNSSTTTQFADSKPSLFPISLLFPFLANIHEYQKEAHCLKIDFLYHVTHSVLSVRNKVDHTPSAINT